MTAPARPPLSDLWLAETIRLREAQDGPLEDADAVRQVRQAPVAIEERIVLRARLLAARTHLSETLQAWRGGAATAGALLAVFAIVAGVGAARGALGDGTQPVNITWAVGALLGLHAATFLLWLLSFAYTPGLAGAGLTRVWLWVARKTARGPDAALVPQALLNLLARADALRWLFGTVSHLLWSLALLAALATLTAMLSTARYHFVWATTLLAPDADIVRASDGLRVLPAAAQAQWSIWLLGLIAVYGVAPRLLGWLASIAMLRRALRRLRIDPALPGYAGLSARLRDPVTPTAEEGDTPSVHQPRVGRADAIIAPDAEALLVGIELPGDVAWPPAGTPPSAHVAANLDTRAQRNRLLDALAAQPVPRLLIVCDVRQTPDRGTLALIADLSAKSAHTRVWLTGTTADAGPRGATWLERLGAAGMDTTTVLRDADLPLRWLEA